MTYSAVVAGRQDEGKEGKEMELRKEREKAKLKEAKKCRGSSKQSKKSSRDCPKLQTAETRGVEERKPKGKRAKALAERSLYSDEEELQTE